MPPLTLTAPVVVGPVRLGVINPHDMALDAELWQWAPAGVSLHCTRLPARQEVVDLSMVEQLSDAEDLARAAGSVAQIRPSAYVYACTSGSFVGGLSGERRIVETVSRAGQAPTVTTSGGLLAALTELGVGAIAVATPYLPEITDKLVDFLSEAGIDVMRWRGLGKDRDIASTAPAEIAALTRASDHPQAQAVFLSCTNLPTFGLLEQLSAELGKPVISANQVTIWAALVAAVRSVNPAGVER